MTTPGAPTRDAVGLVRVRVLVLLVGFTIVGVVACGIFDRFEWAIVLAPAPPAVVMLIVARQRATWRVLALIATVIATALVVVLASRGSPIDTADAFSSGFRDLLSTEWPSPRRPTLIGTVALVLAAGAATSSELVARRRFHLLPLAPLVVCYVLAIALSAPLEASWVPLAGLAVVAIAFVLLRGDGTLRERLVLLRGERRLVPLLAVVAAIAAMISAPIALTARADPRRIDPPDRSAPILDPIEATLALRDLEPPTDLHVVSSDDPIPPRWRTAALTDYDGARWVPALTLRPIGETLGVAQGPTISADVSFLDDDLSLVPLPGPPVRVDAAVETDIERTVVRLAERPEVGQIVPIVAEVAPAVDDVTGATVESRLVDDDVATLSDLAERLAGSGTQLERLDRLAAEMRENYDLDEDVPGGGLQRAFIELFLRDTQRGNTEQFVTAYVLLARSLGVEARVATGFDVGEDAATITGELALASDDATIWAEVALSDGRWVTFDPVPTAETNNDAPPQPEPEAQTPAAPQPPIEPPQEPDNETPPDDEPDEAPSDGQLSAVVQWTLRIGGGLAVILLPFVGLALIVLGRKHRRRKQRLSADTAADRIRGAWAIATDGFVDAGMDIARSATDSEIAVDGEPLVGSARRELHRLATMSSAATYGTVAHGDAAAADAAQCLGAIEMAMTVDRTRRQRWRWRLSLRSLRRRTRSPVSA